MLDILNNVDRSLFLWLNGFHSEFLNPVMGVLSGQLLWLPFVLLFLAKAHQKLSHRELWIFVLFLAGTLMVSDVVASSILKNLTTRLRPCRVEDLKPLIYSFGQKCGGRFGFVSSHAANSTAIVYFAFRTLRLPRSFRILFIMPLLVAYSRIYLGVHYPGDVLGGAVVGLLAAECFFRLFGMAKAPA